MRLLARFPYETVFSTVYFGLKLNLCLAVAGLPLLAALAFSDAPLRAWPFFTALSAAICGPALAAAFATFAGEEAAVWRTFWASYRALFGRASAIAGVAAGLVIVLAVDFRLALGGPFGAATPMLALLIMLVAAVAIAGLAAPAGPRALLAYAYLSIRKWYLSLANLAVLGVLAIAVAGRPAIGLFLLPAPALYVVWANARHIVRPLQQ